MDRLPVPAVLGVPLFIFPPQECHLHATRDDDQEAGAATDPHAFAVIRAFAFGEDVGAQHRTALTSGGQDGQGHEPLALGRVGVAHPGEDHGDADEDQDRQEQAKVPRAHARRGAQDDVTHGRQEGGDDDKGAPVADPVRPPGAAADGEEAKHVGGRGQAVGLDGAEGPHLRDDGRDEEGEGREADVAAKVHERREVRCMVFLKSHCQEFFSFQN